MPAARRITPLTSGESRVSEKLGRGVWIFFFPHLKNALTDVCRNTHTTHTLYVISGDPLLHETHPRTPVRDPSSPSSKIGLSLLSLKVLNNPGREERHHALPRTVQRRPRGSTQPTRVTQR